MAQFIRNTATDDCSTHVAETGAGYEHSDESVLSAPRPAGIGPPLLEKLTFRLINENHQWFLECRNPTPFHISFTTLLLEHNGQRREVESEVDMMTYPFTTHRFRIRGQTPPEAMSTVHYRYIDDNGSVNNRNVRLIND